MGLAGTMSQSGQASVYSSTDSDAPGFQAKAGVGKSSFQSVDTDAYTAAAGFFMVEAWCFDVVGTINKTMSKSAALGNDANCTTAIHAVSTALAKSASQPKAGQPAPKAAMNTDALTKLLNVDLLKIDKEIEDSLKTAKTKEDLRKAANDLGIERQKLCQDLKTLLPDAYNFCPDSGKIQKSAQDQEIKYPAAYMRTMMPFELPAFYYKIAGNWIPDLTSVDYRSINNGVASLGTKQYWTRLLNTGAADVALYYKRLSFGTELAYGETVKVKTQNVCDNTTNGAYTAQSCDVAMVGAPVPQRTRSISGALALNPIPFISSASRLFRSGLQANYYYAATNTGHSTQLSIPLYLAPAITPMALVFGVQPTWKWNTDPTIGNSFAVSIFAGARPRVRD